MNEFACNYDLTIYAGSCEFPETGYGVMATVRKILMEIGLDINEIYGCDNPVADNYDPEATRMMKL